MVKYGAEGRVHAVTRKPAYRMEWNDGLMWIRLVLKAGLLEPSERWDIR